MTANKFILKTWSFCMVCICTLILSNIYHADLYGATIQDLNLDPPEETVDSTVIDSSAFELLWSDFDSTIVTTGVLHDRQGVSYVDFDKYTGDSTNCDTCEVASWRQIYNEMYTGFFDNPSIDPLSVLDSIAKPIIDDRKVPIALIYMNYNAIKDNAIEDGLITYSSGQFVVDKNKAESPCDEKEVFSATTLVDHWTGGLTVPFYIDTVFIKGLPSQAYRLKIDFDDGQGWREFINPTDQTVNITYLSEGMKYIKICVDSTEGPLKYGVTALNVIQYSFPNKDIIITGPNCVLFEFYIPVFGWIQITGPSYQATGIYGDGNNTGKFIKPIIVVEGFDPSNSINFEEMYLRLNQQQLAERVKALGYDLIILNFGWGGRSISANAVDALEHLISYVNQNRAPGTNEKIVLVGASMGGVVSRYALLDMENKSVDHNVRLFVSFDSPQQGANVPIGVQHAIDFFASSPSARDEAKTNRGYLRSPAAKQILIYHFDYFPCINTAHSSFYLALRNMGDYPQAVGLRKVAIANGTGAGLWQWGYTDRLSPQKNMVIVDKYTSVGSAYAKIISMPYRNSGSQTVFTGCKKFAGVVVSAKENKIGGLIPLDNICGGWRNTMGEFADNGVTVYYPNHAFIPTTSALDLRGPDEITPIMPDVSVLGISSYTTPFDDVFCETGENNEHVAVTPAIAEYIIGQIHNLQNNWVLQNITISNEAATYRAYNNIAVAGLDASNNASFFTVTSTGDLTLEAGSQIVLSPGFSAESGSKVNISIEDFSSSMPTSMPGVNLTSNRVDIPFEKIKPDIQPVGKAFLPKKTELHQNYPNPFNIRTNIKYALKDNCMVNLDIYNVLGQKVRTLVNGQKPAGIYSTTWDGKNDRGQNISRGVYLCRLNASDYTKSFKMIFIK